MPTLFGLTILVFVALRVVLPTDVVDRIVGEYGRSDVERQQQLREQLGLSASLPRQYANWMGDILRGDMGRSLHSGIPVTTEL